MNFPVNLPGVSSPYLQGMDLAGWFVLGFSFLLIAAAAWQLRSYQPPLTIPRMALILGLAALAVIFALFTGAEIDLPRVLILPELLDRQTTVLVIVLLSTPWLLAAGYSGPIGGLVVGAVTGGVLGFFSAHNPFMIGVYGACGLAAGGLTHQPYRTRLFSFARRPTGAALFTGLLFPVLFILGTAFGNQGTLVERLNIAFSLLQPESLAFMTGLAAAALVGEVTRALAPWRWGPANADRPSPAERSLETRSFQLMGLVIIVLVLLLSVIGWRVAYGSALDLTRARMIGTAELAAGAIPNALDTGQNLIQFSLQDARFASIRADEPGAALADLVVQSRYFSQALLVSDEDEIIATAGRVAGPGSLVGSELAGLALARAGVPFQFYASDPAEGGAPAVISFVAPVPGSDRVLIARSVLADNPFITPVLNGIQDLGNISGSGILVDSNGTILHHPVAQMVSTVYSGSLESIPGFSDALTPTGYPALVYGLPIEGRSWIILIEVPRLAIQSEALRIATPLLGLLLALAVFSLLLQRVILRVVTGSLRTLSVQARRIAEDRARLGEPFDTTGEDEVGQMRKAFEQMRASLKARMDEQERLLTAGHAVAASLDFSRSVRPLLSAALAGGADCVRVALTVEALPGADDAARFFGAGPAAVRFAYLDEQMIALMRGRDSLAAGNPIGFPGLSFPGGVDVPAAFMAIPLRQQQAYFGVLWLGFRKAHVFTREEERFLLTLGAQGALAAANTALYMTAEQERERLGAILASTPDPIIVTDREDRLLLANPAAVHVLGQSLSAGLGEPLTKTIGHPGLVSVLTGSAAGAEPVEVTLDTEETFVAKVTDVEFRGERIGRVGILRDVTRFKELDELKSKFVTDVTHDLNNPLTLVGGYITMLPLIGEVNPEQAVYLEKIKVGVERMKAIVTNLVMLSRLEAGADLYLEPVQPDQLVRGIVDLIRPAAEQRDIRVELAVPAGLPLIEADVRVLERALANLVDNAVKYSNDEGRVRVAIRINEPATEIAYSIEDDGIGISLSDQDRLFERFFRADNRETRKRHGTGLGLPLVKTAAEKHGGRVVVESEPGRGSTFHFVLPVRQGRAPAGKPAAGIQTAGR